MASALRKTTQVSSAETVAAPAAAPAVVEAVAGLQLEPGPNPVGDQHLRLEAALSAEPYVQRFPPLVRLAVIFGGSGLMWAGVIYAVGALLGR